MAKSQVSCFEPAVKSCARCARTYPITIDDLIMVVAGKVGVSPELICSRSRQRKPSEARAVFSYLAVEETGYPAAYVARFLGVKRMSVHEAVTRGKTLCVEYALLGQKRE